MTITTTEQNEIALKQALVLAEHVTVRMRSTQDGEIYDHFCIIDHVDTDDYSFGFTPTCDGYTWCGYGPQNDDYSLQLVVPPQLPLSAAIHAALDEIQAPAGTDIVDRIRDRAEELVDERDAARRELNMCKTALESLRNARLPQPSFVPRSAEDLAPLLGKQVRVAFCGRTDHEGRLRSITYRGPSSVEIQIVSAERTSIWWIPDPALAVQEVSVVTVSGPAAGQAAATLTALGYHVEIEVTPITFGAKSAL